MYMYIYIYTCAYIACVRVCLTVSPPNDVGSTSRVAVLLCAAGVPSMRHVLGGSPGSCIGYS